MLTPKKFFKRLSVREAVKKTRMKIFLDKIYTSENLSQISSR